MYDPIRWFEAEPGRLELELAEMTRVAPDLEWTDQMDGTTGGGWVGPCPIWPFDRPEPPALRTFLSGQRFQVEVACRAAHPAAVPTVRPIDPKPPLLSRTMHTWHLMGDGSLCLMQNSGDWDGQDPASELVVKAAGWFLELLLMEAGAIEMMTLNGIVGSDELDHLMVAPPASASQAPGSPGAGDDGPGPDETEVDRR